MRSRGRAACALLFVITGILLAASCQPEESVSLGCSAQTPCAEGARCDLSTNRCVSAVCSRAADCCAVAELPDDSCADIGAKPDAVCVTVLKAARDDGYCLEVPGATTYPGLCNTTGSCHAELLNRYNFGESICCTDGLTCQSDHCAACLPEGSACNPDQKFNYACCLGLTCKFGEDHCVPAGAEGADCLFDDECARALTCVDGTCVPPRKEGAACSESEDCEGYPYASCTEGACKKDVGGGGTGGSGTGMNPACESKYCSGCMSSCSGGYCYSCCYACNGATCSASCTD